jgi:hypothetical protein
MSYYVPLKSFTRFCFRIQPLIYSFRQNSAGHVPTTRYLINVNLQVPLCSAFNVVYIYIVTHWFIKDKSRGHD